MIKKAVVLCGGLATRLLPITKSIPKEMMPVLNKPILHYILEDLVDNGIEDCIIVIGRGKECIENYVDRNVELELRLKENNKLQELDMVNEFLDKINITFVRQIDAKGTGYALKRCQHLLKNDNFLLVFGDELMFNDSTPKQLISAFNKTQKSTISLKKVPMSDVSKYGIVQVEETKEGLKVHSIVEKPKVEEAPSNVAILGRYIITPEIFTELEQTTPGAGGEIQLTDALVRLAQKQCIYAYDFIGRRYDVGNKEGFLEATVEFALKREDLRDEFLAYLKSLSL